MKTIITFLGGLGPKLTTYRFTTPDGAHDIQGGFFPLALRQHIADYDEMLVFATDLAQKVAWPEIEKLNDTRIKCVPIATGENTEQIWSIFQKVTSHVHEGDVVTFDITHGLRSIPFMVFLFAAYLKSARSVRIDGIYYGAFELGRDGNPAPVIDLSEFAAMLDWITATDQFVQTGDARRLAQRLNPSGESNTPAAQAAKALNDVSLAAFLCQPHSLAVAAEGVKEHLARAAEQPQLAALPFSLIQRRIESTFGAFIGDIEKDTQSGLCAQYRLINWYYANNQIMQTVSLAREWLIDAVTYRLGEKISRDYKERELSSESVGRAMSALQSLLPDLQGDDANAHSKGKGIVLNSKACKMRDKWEETERQIVARLWGDVREVRNQLDHAEHQYSAKSVDNLIHLTCEKVIKPLRELAKRWGLA